MQKEIHYEDGLPVKVQVMNIHNYPWHIHKDIQVIYVLDGEVELKMTYARYHLVKNSIHIIHNEDVHGFRSLTANNLVVVLSLNMDFFTRHFPNLDTQVFTTKVSENIATYKKQLELKTYLFSIISELHSRKQDYKEHIRNISMELISTLYKDFRGFFLDLEKRTFEHQVSHDMIQIDRISRVVSFVYQNYPYKLSLTDIAASEGINSYYLSHLFQRLVGDSFRNFVSMVRVEMSEVELLTSDASISQISANVGFSNAKYYVENFRQWFGCPPKEYRQLYKGETIDNAVCLVKELPLDVINEAIESYEELPAFTGASAQIKAAAFDFKKSNTREKLPACSISADIFYHNYDPQKNCIQFLREFIEDPTSCLLPQTITDTEENRYGAFTFNGMKKPLYYLREMLMNRFDTISGYDNWYILTTEGTDSRVLLFNDDAENHREFEFSFFNAPGTYLITEHRLNSCSTCISLWGSMDFKSPLTVEQKKQIQDMSAPKISYSTVDSSGSFIYKVKLAPMDIMFADIHRQQ